MATSFVQLNAGTGGAKAQTVQNTIGANVVDANAVVLHDTAGLPIGMIPANTTVTGTLSASDAVVGAPVGDGTLVSGASTAGSVVAAVIPDGFQAWTLLIKGYTTGTVYTEASNNSTNGTDGDWVEVKGRRTGTAPGTESVVYAMVANGYYRGAGGGFKYIRARSIGATGVSITWVLSAGLGATFLNSGIPGGSSSIGTVGLNAGTNAIGTVGVTGSVAVTGTFFQATQPVSVATLPITQEGLVSTANSSAVVLAANGVFTGTSEDVSAYATIAVTVFADVASATDGLSLQQSSNGTNWDNTDGYTIPAGTGKTFSFPVEARYFRVVYTNGATLQAAFRLQTLYHTSAKKGSSVRPQDGRTNDNDFEEVASYLSGFNGTTWDRLRSSTAAPAGTEQALIVRPIPSGTQAVSGTVTSNQGTANTAANAWFVRQTDGTNNATLKAASTAAAATDTALVVGLHPTSPLPAGTNALGKVETESAKATYSIVAFYSGTSTTDWIVIPGSATKTIKIKRVSVSAFATAATNIYLQFKKRTAANTGGTSAAATIVLHDSNDVAATSAAITYSAPPTALGAGGALVGWAQTVGTSTTMPPVRDWVFGSNNDKAPTLRGTTQLFAINLNAVATPAGLNLSVSVEWTEE
jgi:hypothetical protein